MSLRLYPRHNGALDANPPAGGVHITVRASDFSWMVFAVMLISFLGATVWVFSNRTRARIQHLVPVIVLLVSTITQFLMASDLGWMLVPAKSGTRQFFYVRYIQWIVNAPFILLALLSFTAMPTPLILGVLFCSCVFAVCGLAGALISSSYKWALYVFGLSFGLIPIWYFLLVHVRLFGFRREDYRRGYFVGAAFISLVWLPYPISWGLSEGSHTISPTYETIFYGILDILTGPVFLVVFLRFLATFDTQALAPTAFGNAERGIYELQQQPQQHQPPAPAKGAQTHPQNERQVVTQSPTRPSLPTAVES